MSPSASPCCVTAGGTARSPVGDIDQLRLVELMAGTSVDVEFPARPPIPDRCAGRHLGDALLGRRASVRSTSTSGRGDPRRRRRRGQRATRAAACAGSRRPPRRDRHDRRSAVRRTATPPPTAPIYLSGDRASESLLAALNVRENLPSGCWRAWPISASCGATTRSRHADELIEHYGIRVGSRSKRSRRCPAATSRRWRSAGCSATEPSVADHRGADAGRRRAVAHGHLPVPAGGDRRGTRRDPLLVRRVRARRARRPHRGPLAGRLVDEFSGATATEESIVGAFVGATRLAPDTTAIDGSGTSAAPAVRPATVRAVNDFKRMSALVVGLLLIGAYARLATTPSSPRSASRTSPSCRCRSPSPPSPSTACCWSAASTSPWPARSH